VIPQDWVQECLEASGIRTLRQRRLPCAMTVWLVILLALFRRHSYLNLLGMLEGSRWAIRYWRGRPPPCSTALTKARDRLGVEPLAWLYHRSAGEWGKAGGGYSFHGRRVCAIDGFTLKTWDSDENRAHFGAPGASRGSSAFPQMRLVACLDVGTRVLTAVRFGPYAKAEIPLAEELRPELRPGSLVLLDRGFVAYGFLWDLVRQGHDFLVRGKRRMKVRRLQQLGPGDFLVRVRIPRHLRALRPELPRTWTLRQIVAEVPGSRAPRRLLTSLLDPTIRGVEIAALYPRRWDEEIAIDEIKTHLGDAATVNRPLVLRSRTPERVEQEVYGLLIAYNAVRRLMVQSAVAAWEERGEKVEHLRLSFTITLERLREAIRDMMTLPTLQLADRFARFRNAVIRARVEPRPGRSYPRAVRVKMSNYPLKRRSRAG
jgi:hypothetical protein